MDKEPVVIKLNVPQIGGINPHNLPNKPSRFDFLKIFSSSKSTKIITLLSIGAICLTIVSIAAFTVLANNKSFQKKHSLSQSNGSSSFTPHSIKDPKALPGGGISNGVGGCTGTVCPVVTITANPASVNLGGTSTLTWSVTNNPTSCTASDDWSGAKAPSGTESTPKLTKSQTYRFTLTCKNATGTGFSTVSVGTVTQSGGSGNVIQRPQVSFAANPSAIYAGDSSTLTWSVTNSPTSCTASGDWSGVKPTSGPESTGTLTTARQYNYTLSCSNSSGTSPDITIHVVVTNPPPGFPIVTLAANPIGPILPGASTTLSWTTTNNPTSCTASGDWSGVKPANGSFNTGALNTIRSYTYNISCVNSTATSFDTSTILVLPDPPAISLTVNPSSMLVGSSATLNWGVSNNTSGTVCTAIGDWPGSLNIVPTSSGSRSTGVLNNAKTYKYRLSCINEGGSNSTPDVPLNVSLPSPPVVSISVSPISISTGQSATVTWSATNNPSSCTPSGDLSAPISPLNGGSKATGTLSTARTYTYTLQCSNAGGASNVATTSLSVGSSGAAAAPVVTISASPTSINTGSSSTISWSATNSPTSCSAGGTSSTWVTSPAASGSTSTGNISTAGTRTYTITCTNSIGSGSNSVNVTVLALPTVSVSLASQNITTGSSTTYSWSSTGATSCSGGGALSGSMATSGGPINTGAKGTAGPYSYTVTCVNSIGGSASNTVTLTVSNAAQVYCSGKTPCYGVSDLAAHANPGSPCWGWNLDWVINIDTFKPTHPGGTASGSLSTAGSTCNGDIHAILAGSAQIPGYKPGTGGLTHAHNSGTTNNTGTAMTAYRVGYYDATKP